MLRSGRMRTGHRRGVRIRPGRGYRGKGHRDMTSTLTESVRIDQEPYGERLFRRDVGRRIRAQRTLCNLRQEELAERAGVSRNFVSAVERGTQRLDAWRLRHLALALDCDLGWLLLDDQPLPRPRR
jgi:DNA-binding XRE family transcriptional regulator